MKMFRTRKPAKKESGCQNRTVAASVPPTLDLSRAMPYFAQTVYDHAPIVAGHEYVGEVVNWARRQRKIRPQRGRSCHHGNPHPLHESYFCKRGRYNLWRSAHHHRHLRSKAAGREYMKYPKGRLSGKCRTKIPWEGRVALEPLACRIHGVERANNQFGETAVLTGCGPHWFVNAAGS